MGHQKHETDLKTKRPKF